ncbi:MAG: chemotaxis protein CheW [Dongiaceae bacterium]
MNAQLASAEQPAAVAAESARRQIVTFRVGAESYGIGIQSVREIRAWSPATALPEAPDFVRGVINLRGQMVPILDLRARFGQGETEATPTHVVIVVAVGARTVGVLVDAVSDIVSIADQDIKPVPEIGGWTATAYLQGLAAVGEAMVALVGVERLAGR